MNGTCITQVLSDDTKWHDVKIEKAGARAPGIYNLSSATPADLAKAHDGLVIYADASHVYQLVGKGMVKHGLAKFGKAPEIGVTYSIGYSGGKAVVTPSQRRGRSRGI